MPELTVRKEENGAIRLLALHDGDFPINGRELHEQLGVDTPYHKWFPRMCEYGFEAGKDFFEVSDKIVHNPLGGRPATTHMLTLSMAKEICMLQRNDAGRQIRRYLIEVESAWNSPEQVMARALKLADKTIGQLNGQIKALEAQTAADAPKVLFAKSVECADNDILIGDLAKLLRQNGVEVGQKRLFDLLRRDGYLMRSQGTNMPTQKSMELGIMRITERCVNCPDGSTRVTQTPKITGKGQVYFVNRYAGKTA